MKKLLLIGLVASALVACNQQKDSTSASSDTSTATAVDTINVDTMSNDTENALTDFTMPDTEGNPVSIIDEIAKHKLTIIDFWASWCGPCRAEMPNLVRIYAQHKASGLGIIGVSLDKEHDSWVNAIENDNITWLQLSDLQGWDNAAARLYNVNSIPHTIIADQRGNILAEGLRGDDLADFIKEHL